VGQFREERGGIGVVVFAVLKVLIAHRVAVDAIGRQDQHDDEIGQQKQSIEPVERMVDAGERVSEPRFHLMAEAVLGSKDQGRNDAQMEFPERSESKTEAGCDCGKQGESSRRGLPKLYAKHGLGRAGTRDQGLGIRE
jgi:hypothetical protein